MLSHLLIETNIWLYRTSYLK